MRSQQLNSIFVVFRYGKGYLTQRISCRLLEYRLPLRPVAGSFLLDKDRSAPTKPDVEVVSVVGCQTDLWRLHRRNVEDNESFVVFGLVFHASLVVWRLTRGHRKELRSVAQPMDDLKHFHT